jgi:hypothetical protein
MTDKPTHTHDVFHPLVMITDFQLTLGDGTVVDVPCTEISGLDGTTVLAAAIHHLIQRVAVLEDNRDEHMRKVYPQLFPDLDGLSMTQADEIRDKIAVVLDRERKWPDALETADAIMAALPDMIPDLVWEGFKSGPYKIEVHEGGIADLWFCGMAIEEDDEHDLLKGGYLTLVSIDDLKAIANAHNRAAFKAMITGEKT